MEQPPPSFVIYQLASAHYVSHALYVAAHLGVADHLAAGPATLDALAEATGTHAPSLGRVLRFLVAHGVFTEDADGRFGATPVGATLARGPGSTTPAVKVFAGPTAQKTWGGLLESVRTGAPAFERVMGQGPFAYFAERPEEAADFDHAMGAFTRAVASAVAAAYDFAAFGQVIDIGGGEGALLGGVLRDHPSLEGAVFDLAYVAPRAEAFLARAELGDRCRFVSGDFFESIPSGYDAYLIKHVIHDWDDERAAAILANIRRAMSPSAKLLLIEGVYPARVEPSPEGRGATANDCNMLLATGGKQRTEEAFRALFASAGLRLERVIPTMARVSILEAVPA